MELGDLIEVWRKANGKYEPSKIYQVAGDVESIFDKNNFSETVIPVIVLADENSEDFSPYETSINPQNLFLRKFPSEEYLKYEIAEYLKMGHQEIFRNQEYKIDLKDGDFEKLVDETVSEWKEAKEILEKEGIEMNDKVKNTIFLSDKYSEMIREKISQMDKDERRKLEEFLLKNGVTKKHYWIEKIKKTLIEYKYDRTGGNFENIAYFFFSDKIENSKYFENALEVLTTI